MLDAGACYNFLPMSKISLIDTHCHLEMAQFDSDREDVIKRARGAGLEAMITVGSDMAGNALAQKLADEYDFIYRSVGLHPHEAKDFSEDVYRKLSEWASHKKVVAIGETGLDYHYMHSSKETQKEAFRRQLSLAQEKNLPVIVHSREAEKDTLEILKELKVSRGVMHCFSGDAATAEAVLKMGLYISIAGPVTFKNSKKLAEATRAVPDDYLLIETDAPYLTPEPLRGKRNEPAYIVHTAEAIARLRGITLEDVARITTLNAKRLFGIGKLTGAGEVAYKIRASLYLNITNRCTNECSFCIRFYSDFVKGHMLRLAKEPTAEELKSAIGNPTAYKEVVFCGYGEPLLRLDVVRDVASWVKAKGGRVRINTNGHGNLIHGRNILPELAGLIDSISVSLDAHDAETYERLCKPAFKNAFEGVMDFIREAKKHIPDVEASVVEAEGVDIEKCREIAEGLGARLRVRRLDVVG